MNIRYRKKIIIPLVCSLLFMVSCGKSNDVVDDIEIENTEAEIEEETVYIDERTGKSFNIVDDKIEVFLPVGLTYKSKDKNYTVKAEYDDKNRLVSYVDNNTVLGDEEKRTYIYNLDGKFDRMYLEGDGRGEDYSFTYEGYNIIDVKDNEDFGLVLSDDVNVHTSYNSKGIMIESKPNPFFNVEKNDITYSGDGLVSELKHDADEAADYEYLYDGENRLVEMSASGEMEGGYLHYHSELKREGNNVVSYTSDSVYEIYDMTGFDYSYSFDYRDGKIESVSSVSEGKDEGTFTLSYDDDGQLKNISGKKKTTNQQENMEFFYTDNQITKVNINNGEIVINIEYEKHYIDRDKWEEYYKNYYYLTRYEVLQETFRNEIGKHTNFSHYIFEYTEGYINQTLEYETFYKGQEVLYNWAVLPHVIDGDFYKK